MLRFKMMSIFMLSLFFTDAKALQEAQRTLDTQDPLNPEFYEAQTLDLSDSWDSFFKSNPNFSKIKLGASLEGVAPLARNQTDLLLPASLQKLITGAAALKNLGEDFRFENRLSAAFDQNAGVLSDLIFEVSGDPTWGMAEFEAPGARIGQVVSQLSEMGVRKVRGPIEVLSLRPELDQIPRPSGWRKSWATQCMAAMMSSFFYDGNCGEVVISSGLSAKWATPGVEIPIVIKRLKRNEVLESGYFTPNKVGVDVVPTFDESGRITSYELRGALSAGMKFYLPVHQGGVWLKHLFLRALSRAGIIYDEEGTRGNQSLQAISIDLSSVPLIQILDRGVKDSINLILDRVFYELALQANVLHEPMRPLFHLLRSVLTKEDLLQGIVIEDGSGLSLTNRMRADTFYAFLSELRREYYFDRFQSTLAVAGVSGTLKNRTTLSGSSLVRGRLFGKTGTLDGVVGLAGYWKNTVGDLMPFVLMSEYPSTMSRATARGLLDKVVVKFASINSSKQKQGIKK